MRSAFVCCINIFRCDGSASFRGETRCADMKMFRRPREKRCRWMRCSRRPRPHARSIISRWRLVHCRESNDFLNKKKSIRERAVNRRHRQMATEARTASRKSKRYSCSSNLRVAYRNVTIIPCIYSHLIIGNIIDRYTFLFNI